MELNAFSDAVYRSHQGNNRITMRKFADDEIIGQLAWCTSMHRVAGIWREAMRGESVGLPMTRMMFIHYAFDDVASGLTSQFLLGRDMLIAPVLDRKTSIALLMPHRCIWMGVELTILAPSTSTANNKKNDDSEESGGSGTWVTADAPMDDSGVYSLWSGKTASCRSGLAGVGS